MSTGFANVHKKFKNTAAMPNGGKDISLPNWFAEKPQPTEDALRTEVLYTWNVFDWFAGIKKVRILSSSSSSHAGEGF